MITIVKYSAILAVIAMLVLSPFMMTMTTALAVKSDVGSSSIHSTNNKHFDGGSKQIKTHTVTKGNNNNIDKHFNNNNNNNNFNDNFKFKHNDAFRFNNHNNDNFRFHNDNHNNNHDNVKVIHKTVVVHDRDNNQRTIVINSNLQGTCFVTQSQAANVDNLVAQLLDQCVSVTIIQG